jgi:hypothetical protein
MLVAEVISVHIKLLRVLFRLSVVHTSDYTALIEKVDPPKDKDSDARTSAG